VSNRRRLPGARPQAVHCGTCGRGIGKLATRIVLPDGRVVCGGCRDGNRLVQVLACGHVGMPGMQVVRVGDGFVCSSCGADSVRARKEMMANGN
jgi:hypothetical protein